MRIFDDIFWTTIFWFQVCTFPSSCIVKYLSTEISKVFDNYRQVSSEFMTNSIELQMLSEDAASETRTKVSKTSLMRALSFKTY